ncbi:RNase adapter RapZ [Treponema sp. HNW]|uniref:RapZ C-terminal domain-containing protein n=1 Tax=Treponema sp. HNW TaxID=3116654 RepID=UPI003D09875E
MQIEFTAFGFKYGILAEADIVFDVRCLENPFYVPALRDKTGEDKEVRDFIMSFPETDEVLKRIRDYLEYTIPLYEKKGKERLVVGFGCTGGQHRSVTCLYVLRDCFAVQYPHIRIGMRDMERNQKALAQK